MESPINARPTLWPTLFRVAILSALLATVLSSLAFVGLGALDAIVTKRADFEAAPTVWDVVKATFLFCALTAVWYGPFGLLAGGLGAAILHFRRKRIHTLKRLLLESSVLGVVAAIVLPFYAVAALQSGRLGMWYELVAILPMCVASSIICALVFRRHLVEQPATS